MTLEHRWIFMPIVNFISGRNGSPSMPVITSRGSAASKVAHGQDAVDGAFATVFGEALLTHFQVWAYQVNPRQVSVGDPIDLSKRLDGTPTVRLN